MDLMGFGSTSQYFTDPSVDIHLSALSFSRHLRAVSWDRYPEVSANGISWLRSVPFWPSLEGKPVW
jgi:hypothetical protein